MSRRNICTLKASRKAAHVESLVGRSSEVGLGDLPDLKGMSSEHDLIWPSHLAKLHRAALSAGRRGLEISSEPENEEYSSGLKACAIMAYDSCQLPTTCPLNQ
jgi:hypothetical protein